MTFIYGSRVIFGFTVICQQGGNDTELGIVSEVDPDYYLMDTLNVAWMFTSTAIGMCLGPFPIYFFTSVSTRRWLFFYGLMSGLSSLMYPLSDSFGFWPALICRFFTGFAQAAQLHFVNDIVLRWAPGSESSFFFAVMLATSQMGPLVAMIMGGEMCSSSFFGWESTYYVLGLCTIVFTTLLAYFYSDSVESNKYLCKKEKQLILDGKQTVKEKEPVPHKLLMTDWTIWISLIMFTGYCLAMTVYQQYSPTFIKQVLHFSIRETGYFSGIPQLIAIFIKIGGGKLLDCKFGISQKLTLAIPLVVLEFFSALSLFLTGFVESRVLSLVFMMVFASLHFFVPVICCRTIQIRAGQHAHFALNINMIIVGVAQIVIPFGVQAAVPDNTRSQWSLMFYFLAATVIVTTIMYCFFARAKLASWAVKKPSEEVVRASEIDEIENSGKN